MFPPSLVERRVTETFRSLSLFLLNFAQHFTNKSGREGETTIYFVLLFLFSTLFLLKPHFPCQPLREVFSHRFGSHCSSLIFMLLRVCLALFGLEACSLWNPFVPSSSSLMLHIVLSLLRLYSLNFIGFWCICVSLFCCFVVPPAACRHYTSFIVQRFLSFFLPFFLAFCSFCLLSFFSSFSQLFFFFHSEHPVLTLIFFSSFCAQFIFLPLPFLLTLFCSYLFALGIFLILSRLFFFTFFSFRSSHACYFFFGIHRFFFLLFFSGFFVSFPSLQLFSISSLAFLQRLPLLLRSLAKVFTWHRLQLQPPQPNPREFHSFSAH